MAARERVLQIALQVVTVDQCKLVWPEDFIFIGKATRATVGKLRWVLVADSSWRMRKASVATKYHCKYMIAERTSSSIRARWARNG